MGRVRSVRGGQGRSLYNRLPKKYAIYCAVLVPFRHRCQANMFSADPVICTLPFFTSGGWLSQAQMYAMQSIDLIAEFLHDRLGAERDQVKASALLADLGMDSLMLAELMFEAEDKFGISIASDTRLPQTVGDVVALFDGLMAGKAAH
jgi:acyl carrier protein